MVTEIRGSKQYSCEHRLQDVGLFSVGKKGRGRGTIKMYKIMHNVEKVMREFLSQNSRAGN